MKIVHYHSTTTTKNYAAHWKKRKAIDATYKKLKDSDFLLTHILQNGAVNFMQALNCCFYLYIESSMW